MVLFGLKQLYLIVLTGILFDMVMEKSRFGFYFILRFLLLVGPVSKYRFDIRVKKFTEFPNQSALESSAKHFNAMQTPAKLSFDAPWSYRNAKHFINLNSCEIVAFSILDKFINDEFVNYKIPSSHLETRCFE